MIDEYKTLENLKKLSLSDLNAIIPYAGDVERGWLKLVYKAIDYKISKLIVNYPDNDKVLT